MAKEKMFDESISEEDRMAIQAALDGDDNFGEDHELEMAIQASLNIERRGRIYFTCEKRTKLFCLKSGKIFALKILLIEEYQNFIMDRTHVDILEDLLGKENEIQIKIMFLNREHQPLSIKVNS